LRDQRWQIAGFGAALASMAAMIVLLWPAYRDQLALIEIPPALQALLGNDLSIATPAGFINAEYFSWIPVLLIVYAITQGTGAIAGEEASGTVELLLAQPLRRSALVLARTLATACGMVMIVLMGWLGFVLTLPFVDMDVAASDLLAGCLNMLPIGAFFFALSLWLGAVAPSRAYAAAVATAVVTFAYFADSLAAGVEEISWVRYASPYYYFGRGLAVVEGIDWAHAAVLLGLSALFFAGAVRSFDRRDVTPGGATQLRITDILHRVYG
jgi:ABC-2 type transport system permease protein